MLKSTFSRTKSVIKLREIKFPERFKNTIIEKWAKYWKNLFIDYQQMLKDLRTDVQDNPQKAILWTTGLTCAALLHHNNPTEVDFKDSVRRISNETLLISDNCRNPHAAEHIRFIQKSYNEGVLHYANFGIASIMYVSPFNEECNLYKSQCDYIKPSYFSFPSRIVDFGLMGRWWNLFIATVDYDVNE